VFDNNQRIQIEEKERNYTWTFRRVIRPNLRLLRQTMCRTLNDCGRRILRSSERRSRASMTRPRGEPLFPILFRYLSYPLECAVHTVPALSAERP
jgi:hypothetical protein